MLERQAQLRSRGRETDSLGVRQVGLLLPGPGAPAGSHHRGVDWSKGDCLLG